MNEKSVYIIIINWKNIYDTCDCLKSLSTMEYPNYHILLINNDEDDFPDNLIVDCKNVTTINNNKNLGFAEANNIGIRYAIAGKAEYVLILNNDTVVSNNFLVHLINYCEKHHKSIVSPIILKHNTDIIENLGGKIINGLGMCLPIKRREDIDPDYLSGACFLGKSEYFEDIGLFDEVFFTYYEDVDWSFRAMQKGYCLKIIWESVIHHKHSASTKERSGWGSLKAYYIARNSIVFGKKEFHGLKKLIWLSGYLVFGSNIHLLVFVRNIKAFKNHYLGIWDGLFNRPIRFP